MIDTLGFDASRPVYLPDPVNRQHPHNYGLKAWFLSLPPLDGGAFLYDLMGLYKGVLTNMGTGSGWSSTTRPGGAGQLIFDGTDDRVLENNVISGYPFTFMCWAYPRDAVSSKSCIAVGKDNGGTRNINYLEFGAGQIELLQFSAGSFSSLIGPSYSANAWYRAAATCDASGNAAVYVNGGNLAAGSLGPGFSAPTGQNKTCIGGFIDADGSFLNPFNGFIDDVKIYNRVLSAAEIKADYDLSRLGYPGVLNRIGPRMWAPGAAPPSSGHLLSLRRRMVYAQ